ncbi:hypothetical protein [Streptomyces sp. KM273126]|nr:hypothetical protein [Streptomyces sp. KM273126]
MDVSSSSRTGARLKGAPDTSECGFLVWLARLVRLPGPFAQ